MGARSGSQAEVARHLDSTFSGNLAPKLPRDCIPEPVGDTNARGAKADGEEASAYVT